MFEQLTAALLERNEGWKWTPDMDPGVLTREVPGDEELTVDIGLVDGKIRIAVVGNSGDEMYTLTALAVSTLLPEIDDYVKRYLDGSL